MQTGLSVTELTMDSNDLQFKREYIICIMSINLSHLIGYWTEYIDLH